MASARAAGGGSPMRDDAVDQPEARNAYLVQQLNIGPHGSAHRNGITTRFHLLSPPVQYPSHVPTFGRPGKGVADLWIGRRRFPWALELPGGLQDRRSLSWWVAGCRR